VERKPNKSSLYASHLKDDSRSLERNSGGGERRDFSTKSSSVDSIGRVKMGADGKGASSRIRSSTNSQGKKRGVQRSYRVRDPSAASSTAHRRQGLSKDLANSSSSRPVKDQLGHDRKNDGKIIDNSASYRNTEHHFRDKVFNWFVRLYERKGKRWEGSDDFLFGGFIYVLWDLFASVVFVWIMYFLVNWVYDRYGLFRALSLIAVGLLLRINTMIRKLAHIEKTLQQ
jgi:hypothetical protein